MTSGTTVSGTEWLAQMVKQGPRPAAPVVEVEEPTAKSAPVCAATSSDPIPIEDVEEVNDLLDAAVAAVLSADGGGIAEYVGQLPTVSFWLIYRLTPSDKPTMVPTAKKMAHRIQAFAERPDLVHRAVEIIADPQAMQSLEESRLTARRQIRTVAPPSLVDDLIREFTTRSSWGRVFSALVAIEWVEAHAADESTDTR